MKLDLQNRSPEVLRLADKRLRVTRTYDVVNFVPKSPAELLTDVWLDWGTEDAAFAGVRLIKQDVSGQTGLSRVPNAEPPKLVRVYEEIPVSAEIQVGNNEVIQLQDGRVGIKAEFLQFSSAAATPGTVNVTTAPGVATAFMLTEDAPNDGTLRRITRTYETAGTISITDETKYDGALLIRTIVSVHTAPSTPANYTTILQKTDDVLGFPRFTYSFACGSIAGGAGGVIDTDIQYEISPDQGATGIVRTTITYISDPSIVSNPITGPGGSELISVDAKKADGYKTWQAVYVSGQGVIASSVETRDQGKLIIYKKTAINSAPSAPSPTIGGTVVQFENSVRNGTRIEAGTLIYEAAWAEANGLISIDTRGQPDGALIYTVVQIDNTSNTAVAYPGSGTAYCVSLEHINESGFYRHIAIWHKLPASVTLRQQVQWEKPGIISFTGSPPQFVAQSPISLTLLASRTIDYNTAQVTTAPYTVSYFASFTEAYTPTDTGIAVTHSKAWGGYLGAASSISGTNSDYNGVLCTTWQAVIISSSPDSLPTGTQTVRVHNDIYLTDIAGTVVYRRDVTTIAVP